MPFVEGGFTPKTVKELGDQLKSAQETIGKKSEHALVPPSVVRRDIFKMPLEEIKTKYARRYEMYVQLVRDKRQEKKSGETQMTVDEIVEMKKWLTALNSLDEYIIAHHEGSETTLRGKQIDVFEDLRNFIEAGGKEGGYIKLPTGTGKTVLFVELIETLDLRSLVVVPRNLLIEQTERSLTEFAPDLDVGKVSGRAKEFGRQVTIITYESFVKQVESGVLDPKDYDCLILDEAHMSLSKKRMEVVNKFKDSVKIGFTATPKYLQNKEVGNLLKKEIHSMSIREAIEDEGLMAPLSAIIARTTVDLSKVTINRGGEYNEKELARAVNVSSRNVAAVNLYKENFAGELAVAYCVGVDHAEAVAKEFNDAGIKAAVVSGRTPRTKQKEILQRYNNGEIKVLCNADLLVMGFDERKTSVCLNLRPTLSKVVAEQRGGRALRIDDDNPNKFSTIVDILDQGINEDHPPVLFADVADGVRFLPKRCKKGGKIGVTPPRPPFVNVPGLEVITDVEEIMKLVARNRDIEKMSRIEFRTVESALEELEKAFEEWKALPSEKRNKFSPRWLIDNGYNGLYQWSRKNTLLPDLVKLSANAELKNNFETLRSLETAVKELEEAFIKWQALSSQKKGKFNSHWLQNNGYSALVAWSFRNTTLLDLVVLSTNKELKDGFKKMERVVAQTVEASVKKLEEAFEQWQALPLESRGKFHKKWLEDHGYRGLLFWSDNNISLSELVVLSRNEEGN